MSRNSPKHAVTPMIKATVAWLFRALVAIMIFVRCLMAADRAVSTRVQRSAPSDTRPEVTAA